MLHFVDDVAAGLEGLVAVRGCSAYPHGNVGQRKAAQAVHAQHLRHAEPHRAEALANARGVVVDVVRRERHERDVTALADELADVALGMIEEAVAVNDGAGDEEEAHFGGV
jgi:hypothetical protein